MERRYLATTRAKVECREHEGKTPTIEGYAAVFYDGTPDTQFELWDGAVERIMPGAFDRAIAENDDARALFNHDPNQLLGRRSADTLTLSKDGTGLRYVIVPADTAVARDVVQHVTRGDLQGSSFSFRVMPGGQKWRTEERKDDDELEIREIHDVELFDVGPVTFPAYEATTTDTRSGGHVEDARASHDKWSGKRASERRAGQLASRAREQRLDKAETAL